VKFAVSLIKNLAMMTEPAPRGYMPQLDALRFFAVLGVILTHNGISTLGPWVLKTVDPGRLGVRLFFVLSGFLITGILYDCRLLAEKSIQTRGFLVRQFYIRRFLRIFPVYYLTLAILFIANVAPVRAIWPWLTLYAANFYVMRSGDWISPVGHFWSLAVEEQFYLVWPWLVLFAPRKWLTTAITVIVLSAPVYRVYAALAYPIDYATDTFAMGTFILASIDSLGLGALLALWSRDPLRAATLPRDLTQKVLPVGAAVFFLFSLLTHYTSHNLPNVALGDTSLALMFCWLIDHASHGFKGWLGAFLEWRPFVYLGKISYGIYIFHTLTPLLLAFGLGKLGIEYPSMGLTRLVCTTIATIIVAATSWHAVEKPLNDLKRYFAYGPYHAVPVAVVPVSEDNTHAHS
jgi:peptidoglycan/LPS O-acetylase OafA/YrhL